LALGAAYAVVDDPAAVTDPRCLLVEDVLTSLQQLAQHHRRQLRIPFLAITGSNGKTTTKELVRAVLAMKYKTLATKGNLNNHIGVPLTILSITDEIEFAVIEMGANHQQEIASYCKIVEPDYGLITNVGKAHLEGFGGFEGVKKGKGELYEWIGAHGKLVFLNNDNPHLVDLVAVRGAEHRKTYGASAGSDCRGELLGELPGLHLRWTCGTAAGEIRARIVGRYNFENVLAAICIGSYFGVAPDAINEAIASYEPDNSRSQLVRRGNNTIVLDAYNANPTSMEAALKNFEAVQAERKVVCLGEMAELGEASGEEHMRLVERLRVSAFSNIVLVGPRFAVWAGRLSCMHFDDSEKAAAWMRQQRFEHTWFLVKGSRSTKMEKVAEAIVG
jgi:UDP-N-acetylmuramoyl-tripeptide--D-alanyl-D-alanine ligase